MTQTFKQCFLFLIMFIAHNKVMSDDIREKIDKAVEVIREGIPENIEIKDVIDYTIPEESAHSGRVKLKDVKITGIKDFDFLMNYVWMITYLPRSFVLTLEDVDAVFDYDCSVDFFRSRFFRFWGNGSIRYKIQKLVLVGNISVTGGVISKTPFEKITLNIQDTQAGLANLLENDEFSTLVTDFINNYLNLAILLENNHENVTKFLTDAANKIVQNILNKDEENEENNEFFALLSKEELETTIRNLLDTAKNYIDEHIAEDNPIRDVANMVVKIIDKLVQEIPNISLKPADSGNIQDDMENIRNLLKGTYFN